MIGPRIPQRGDVYSVDPNPTVGKEQKDRHRYVVLSPREINYYGVSIAVAITSGGGGPREMGITVPITGHDTKGVAVCNQIRSFDLQKREREGTASHVDHIDEATVKEIANKVASAIGAD